MDNISRLEELKKPIGNQETIHNISPKNKIKTQVETLGISKSLNRKNSNKMVDSHFNQKKFDLSKLKKFKNNK